MSSANTSYQSEEELDEEDEEDGSSVEAEEEEEAGEEHEHEHEHAEGDHEEVPAYTSGSAPVEVGPNGYAVSILNRCAHR